MTLEIAEAHGKKFSWTFNMARYVSKARTLKKWSAEFKWLEIEDFALVGGSWLIWANKDKMTAACSW